MKNTFLLLAVFVFSLSICCSCRSDSKHEGSDKKPLAKDNQTKFRDYFPSWSSDAKEIIYLTNRDGSNEIYRMDIASGSKTRITNNSHKEGRPVSSPDGKWIAFYSEESGDRELFVMDAQGQNKRQITDSKGKDEALNWSPDNKALIFYSERDGNGEIYMKDIASGKLTRITNHPARDRWPAFSPDKKHIVFNSDRDSSNNNDIYIYSFEADLLKRITENERDNYNPEWSPTGDKIAYVSVAGEESLIVIIDIAGNKLQTISAPGSQDLEPKWSPDGKKLVFVSIIEGNWEFFVQDWEKNEKIRLTYE